MTAPPPATPVFASYPSLRGRAAFVSGGASGLGAEFVAQLAGQGARVAFVDVDVERGRALEQTLRDDGARRAGSRPATCATSRPCSRRSPRRPSGSGRSGSS